MSRLAALSSALVFACCCASVRVEHAQKVGAAGEEWARATDAVLRLAEQTSIDADSARALSEAQGLSKETRREVLEKHAGIAAVVADLERLRRHARLLARYFERLRELSDERTDAAAEEATSKAADAAVDLGRELTGSKLLAASERDVLARSASLVSRGVRERGLSRELERRAPVIDRELRLQQALLEAVRRQIRADTASLRELGLSRDVVRPYVEGAIGDPLAWIALRRAYVLPPDPQEALERAGDAASRLRAAWAALSEGRLDDAAWSRIEADARDLIAWVRLLEESRR